MLWQSRVFLILAFAAVASLTGCTQHNELGSTDNPLKIALTPGKEAAALLMSGNKLRDYLRQEMKVQAVVSVPASYIAVVEALGSQQTDLAILNTLGYLIAHKKYKAQAVFTLTNQGRSVYKGQIIAHQNGVKTLQELNGKKFAFVDPISSSGYLLPKNLFEEKNIKLKNPIFAGRHDNVVAMVYNKQVDAGATFYLPPEPDGRPYDARRLVEKIYPDVFQKVVIIGYTQEVPNEAMVVRAGLEPGFQQRLLQTLEKWIATPDGQATLKELYGCDGLKPSKDEDYDSARKIFPNSY